MPKHLLYALFVRRNAGPWKRVTASCYQLPRARQIYQNMLLDISLAGDYEPRLRPVAGVDFSIDTLDSLKQIRAGSL